MSMSKVLELARAELGTTEDPPGSNLTKYGFWYGVDGVPWCVIFLCWLFNQAGERMAFFGGGKTARCSVLLEWYQKQGLTVPVEDVKPGDIVILNFSGTKDTEHCGLVTKVSGRRIDVGTLEITTIEGNTSAKASQSNGDRVCEKTRYPSQIVAVCRPQYKQEESMKDDITGHWAEEAIRRCMKRKIINGYPDGSFAPDKPITRAEAVTMIDRLVQLLIGEDDGK